MPGLQNLPALLISLMVHLGALGLLATVRYSLLQERPVVMVETAFSAEREQEEFTQRLQIETAPSESMSLTSGGTQATALGSASLDTAQKHLERSESLQKREFRFNVADLSTPGVDLLGTDLGEAQISGEVGAHVDGYATAMSRMTQELLRVMREQQVIACWLFDESNSLEDDREEIRSQFDKIYDELNLSNDHAVNGRFATLETMIYSYGEQLHPITAKPTADLKQIRDAIGKVPVDETGTENTFHAISSVLDEHSKVAARTNRKLIVILLTDEIGDDADMLEEVIAKAKRFQAPIFVLGRESVFGYPYAHVRWVNPESNLTHWIRVNRGPETAFPECLQYDGFRGRHDSYSSGFGPYAQVRLVKESGGIFFLLAGDESNLAGRAVSSGLDRQFDSVAMKEYEPLLLEQREYARRRDASDFRRSIWNVIVTLNPHIDDQLVLRWHHYSIDPLAFAEEGKTNFDRAVRAMAIINQQLAILERIRPLRGAETEQRWRAAYDLLNAQLIACRVREFQYLLALDRHVREQPRPQEPDTNFWDLTYTADLIQPDPQQVSKTNVKLDQIEQQRLQALTLYEQVIRDHPDTPWAMVAADERRLGFGIDFTEKFWDPRIIQEEERGVIPKF